MELKEKIARSYYDPLTTITQFLSNPVRTDVEVFVGRDHPCIAAQAQQIALCHKQMRVSHNRSSISWTGVGVRIAARLQFSK